MLLIAHLEVEYRKIERMCQHKNLQSGVSIGLFQKHIKSYRISSFKMFWLS